MNEKMPSGNEGEVDQSRRSFLKRGIAALGAVAAVGGAAYLANQEGEESLPGPLQMEAPYNTSVEEMNRNAIVAEIVHDKAAILRLETFLSEGFPTVSAQSVENVNIMYFINRYPDPAHPPSKQEIEVEIETLRTRISLLEARRDQPVE